MDRIAVFFDYQNMLCLGHDTFSRSQPEAKHLPNPYKIAKAIADKRELPSEVVAVRVYRGTPCAERDRWGALENQRQAQHWERCPNTSVTLLPLSYVKGRPREKAVDTSLTADFIEASRSGLYDTVVLFSSDRDMLRGPEWCPSQLSCRGGRLGGCLCRCDQGATGRVVPLPLVPGLEGVRRGLDAEREGIAKARTAGGDHPRRLCRDNRQDHRHGARPSRGGD